MESIFYKIRTTFCASNDPILFRNKLVYIGFRISVQPSQIIFMYTVLSGRYDQMFDLRFTKCRCHTEILTSLEMASSSKKWFHHLFITKWPDHFLLWIMVYNAIGNGLQRCSTFWFRECACWYDIFFVLSIPFLPFSRPQHLIIPKIAFNVSEFKWVPTSNP